MQYPEIPNVEFMGDVHLGRRFIEGVPIDRRGEREEMVWEQFEQDLNNLEADLVHIQVGDLFDGFDVDNAVVLRAAQIYIAAAQRLRSVQFYILRGNHDASRSDTRVSSFDLFAAIVAGQLNIAVITEPYVTSQGFGLLPWDPYKSANEQAQELQACLPTVMQELSFIVCHCDTKAWNGNDFNVLPLDHFERLTKIVVTGHEHIKRSFMSKGVTVHVTGSLQPYSHGEDPDHTMYWTGTVAELALIDPTNLYIRVVLQPGEDLPPIPNCLGFKTVAAAAVADEEADIEVAFEEFNTTAIFKGILKDLDISPEVQALVLGKFTESLNA